MPAPLPPGWSQAEMDQYYLDVKTAAYADALAWTLCRAPMNIVPHVAIKLGLAPGPLPPLPVAMEQLEFDNLVTALLLAGNAYQQEFISVRFPPFIQPNLVDQLAASPPQTIGLFFDFTTGTMPYGATATRASLGWYFNNSLVLTQAAINEARFDYGASGLRGLLNEPSRFQGVANNTMVGGVAGTPGTDPTGWNWSTTADSVTKQLVGFGQEDGINYMDFRFFGTPTGSATKFLAWQGYTIAASVGQTWSGQVYARLMAGSFANWAGPMQLLHSERNAGGGGLASSSMNITPTTAPLRTQRFTNTRTYNQATVAWADMDLRMGYTSGQPVDVTIRFGLPHMQQGNGDTSPIKTTNAAVTRAADVTTLAVPAATYSAITIVRESGPTVLNNVVVGGGGYVVPVDPSPLRSVNFQ